MPFDWSKFLDLARRLSAETTDEASLRSAVSRAYYAAFNTAADRMRQDGKTVPEDGTAHVEVWRYYSGANDQFSRKIGSDGSRLKTRRRDSDYDGRRTPSAGEVNESVERADSVIRFLKKLK